MSKYDRLSEALEHANAPSVPFSFGEIEKILGFELPPSARKHRPWWSNDAKSSHVQAHSWLNAGFKATQVNMESETLVFEKAEMADPGPAPDAPIHPVLGCMKGTVTVSEGVDLTEPAMPEWAEMTESPKLYNE